MDTAGRLIVLCLWLAGTAAHGQSPGRIELTGGFAPDPAMVDVAATGRAPADTLVRGCPGFVETAQAATVALADPATPLRFQLAGESVAGLIVAGPDGIHHCAAPDAEFGVAQIRFHEARAGDYRIWPGAAGPGVTVAGTLLVSEMDISPADAARAPGLAPGAPLFELLALRPEAAPAAGEHILDAEDPLALTLALSAAVSADFAGPGCAGAIDPSRPDAAITLSADEPLFGLWVEAEYDTTLVVAGPDGAVICNDDSIGLNPRIVLSDAAAGRYAVWVGLYGAAAAPARLLAGRAPPDGATVAADAAPTMALATEAEPAFGRHVLPDDGEITVEIAPTGLVGADVAAPSCAGAIDPGRPDLTVTLTRAEPVLWVRARADADTTLVVATPDGRVLCNDDAVGFDPAVSVENALPGDHAIWVGVYGGGEGAPATVTVGRAPPDAEADESVAANPFAGREIASAAEALAILMDELGLAGTLGYERLEEQGAEGLTLHGVTLLDPSGAQPPLRIARIRIADLDLAGLAASGAPDRFALTVEEIDYATLARGARDAGAAPLPDIPDAPPVSLEIALSRVADDPTARSARLALRLEGWLGLSAVAGLRLPEASTGIDPDILLGEWFEIAIADSGFLRAALAGMAEQSGESVDALAAQALEALAQALAPMTPGGDRERLHAAVAARLADLGQPGTLRLRVTLPAPSNADALLGALAADDDTGGATLEAAFEPAP